MSPFPSSLVLFICSIFSFVLYVFLLPAFSQLHRLRGPRVRTPFSSHLKFVLDPSISGKLVNLFIEHYGSSFRINGVGCQDERLLSVDPIAMSHVLNRPWIYEKPWQSRRIITRLIGEGLLGSEGIIHKRLRKVSNPAFSPQSLREFLPIFFKKGLELRDLWRKFAVDHPEGHEIDVCHWLNRLTIDIIGETGFDYAFNAIQTETNEVYLAFRDMFASVFTKTPEWELFLGVYFPLFNKFWPSKTNRTVENSQRVIRTVGKEVIRRKKDALEKGKDPGKDLLTLLLKSNMSNEIPPDQRISNEDLFNQISTFLFAGSDTSSLALTWTLQLLSEYPDVQNRLRCEIRGSCQMSNDIKDMLVAEDLSTLDLPYTEIFKTIDSLPYLDNVIRESLRLVPPIHSSLRVATRDDYIPFSEPAVLRDGTKQSGLWIKKGQVVHVPFESFNLNQTVWGEDALSFNPDRWLNITKKMKQQPGLYPNNMSFSSGPRACIAMPFALMEIKVILYILLTSFTFEKTVDIMKVYVVFTRPFIQNRFKDGSQCPLRVRCC